MGKSLKAIVDAVNRAIWAKNDTIQDESLHWRPMDVLEDGAVVRIGRDLMRVEFSFNDEDGRVMFGDPVSIDFTESNASMGVALTAKPEGYEWDVVLIKPGLTLNRWFFPAEILAAHAELWEEKPVFAFPETRFNHHKDPRKKVAKKMVGWTHDVRVDDQGQIVAKMSVMKHEFADAIRTTLVREWDKGVQDLLGLSIHATCLCAPLTLLDGTKVNYVTSIREALSTELVLTPAAGGKLVELVASVATEPQESGMKEQIIALLSSSRPKLFASLDVEGMTAEELLEAALSAQPEPGTVAQDASAEDRMKGMLTEVKVLRSETMVARMAADSKLPAQTQARLIKQFKGQVTTEEAFQSAIDEERDYLTSIAPGRIEGAGQERPGIEVGAEKLDKLQAGLDAAFGLEPENSDLKNIGPITLRAFYDAVTMGHDPEVHGNLSEGARQEMAREAFTTATLPNALGNTMSRVLSRDYNAVEYFENLVISSKKNVKDFKVQESIRLGYFSDLPDIDTEAAAYAELAAFGEEKSTYSAGQKGAKVTVTRKHIINDDIGVIARLVPRLARAARRTHARFVWDFFISNATMTLDSKALFHADHNNLTTVALSIAQLAVLEAALFNQTEPDSDELLALSMQHLIIPQALKGTALSINQSRLVPGSTNNDANRYFQHFGERNERIIVLPFMTDANDWITLADKSETDMVEMGYLNGREEPEIFLQDQPTVGAVFTNDQMTWKIRHEYGGEILDYRGAQKAVVA